MTTVTTLPDRLVELADALGLMDLRPEGKGWRASVEFDSVWPIPLVNTNFGKQASCIVGSRFPVSCAEVELTIRSDPSWDGGWFRDAYRANASFPGDWAKYAIDRTRRDALLAEEFPRAAALPSEGTPDLVFARSGRVVTAECKRQQGWYLDNECERKRLSGDGERESQRAWLAMERRRAVPAEALLTVWWIRRDIALCGD
jgi:hypothetical protein